MSVLEKEPDVDISIQNISLVKLMAAVALDLGMPDKARALLRDPEGQAVPADELELYLRLAAARGDYAQADRLLDDALHHAWEESSGQQGMANPAVSVGLLLGRILMAEAQHLTGAPSMPWMTNNPMDIVQRPRLVHNGSDFWRRRWRLEALVNGLLANQQRSMWTFVRGWFALEAGHCAQAREHFRTVQETAIPAASWVPEVNRLNAWFDPQQEATRMQQVGYRHALLHDQSKHYLNWLNEEANP
jgi:hypothetical protein